MKVYSAINLLVFKVPEDIAVSSVSLTTVPKVDQY